MKYHQLIETLIRSFLQGLINDLIKTMQANNHFINYPKHSEWFMKERIFGPGIGGRRIIA